MASESSAPQRTAGPPPAFPTQTQARCRRHHGASFNHHSSSQPSSRCGCHCHCCVTIIPTSRRCCHRRTAAVVAATHATTPPLSSHRPLRFLLSGFCTQRFHSSGGRHPQCGHSRCCSSTVARQASFRPCGRSPQPAWQRLMRPSLLAGALPAAARPWLTPQPAWQRLMRPSLHAGALPAAARPRPTPPAAWQRIMRPSLHAGALPAVAHPPPTPPAAWQRSARHRLSNPASARCTACRAT